MTDRLGQQLGNYYMIHLLGRGGFAEVYLGEHIFLKSLAALKVLHKHLTADDAEQFVQESQSLARLTHPHIVRVLDFAIQDGMPFLVMEYAPNGMLRKLHPAGTRLPAQAIIPYVQQVASALMYAHDQGLIHRDVKPENMLLTARREVVLSDFGLAMLSPHIISMSTQTIDQSMSGTIPYMAPEQLQGKPCSASDQYALGIVVYEWLCGRRPFSGSSIEIAMQHLSVPPPSMHEQVPDLSPAIEEVVLRALAKEPKDRFAHVQEFVRALEKASQEALESHSSSLHPILEGEPPLPKQGQQILDSSVPKQEPIWKMPATFTPLIGREKDVAAITTLFTRLETRLVTLLGAGGIGKTRLSMQVAVELRDHFADGVCFVSLAPISDPTMVVPTIAQALNLTEVRDRSLFDQLKTALRDKNLLLLLDNFEQVVVAAPHLLDLLAVCRHLKMLVTSRSPLHLRGEQQFPVPPLALPDLKQLPEGDSLLQYAAVALFVQLAQAVKPDFQLTNANARAVADICVRLDGLPLAIELAAARIKVLPPHALLARLSQRLLVLTGILQDAPARQQTLRNTIEWSYNLLDPYERQLFQRLSVFVGGCTLEAIEAICAALDTATEAFPVLDGVFSLIDNSLLQQMEEGKEPRLVMLETLREFGLECLQESGEVEAIRRVHAKYYMALLEEAEPHLKGEQQLVWLKRLEQEAANVFAALEAAFEYGMHTDLMRGVYAFVPFLLLSGAYALAKQHLQRAHEVATALGDHRSATNALLYLGNVAHEQGEYPQAEVYLQEGLILARHIGDHELISALLADLGSAAWKRGEYTQAEAYLQEGLTMARQIENRERISAVLDSLGAIAGNRGEYNHAETYLQEGLILARQIGNRERISSLLINLAATVGDQGNYAQAEVYLQEGLALARQMGNREQICLLLLNLGETAHDQGNDAQAEVYLQEGLALARQIGYPQWISALLSNFGSITRKQADYTRAEVYLQESLFLARQIGWPRMISEALYEYGFLYLNRQQIEAAEASFREMLTVLPAGDQDLIVLAQYGLARVAAAQDNIPEARQLGEASVKALEAMGHHHAKEVRQWLDLLPVPVPTVLQPNAIVKPPLPRTYPDNLTAREVEVLRLAAKGLTNELVAEQLVISPRTVNSHLTSIYSKIQVSSRSAATRYAIEHNLV